MYNNSIVNTGEIEHIYINSPEVMIGFTNTIIIYLFNLLIDDDEDITTKLTPLLNNIVLYIKNVTIVNNITDENIEFILGKHRADQNQARLKRFQKKDKEDQGLHKIYRQYNLGNQITEEPDIDTSEVGFMSTSGAGNPDQITMIDGQEVDQELYDEEDRDGLMDNAYDYDMEDIEEYGE